MMMHWRFRQSRIVALSVAALLGLASPKFVTGAANEGGQTPARPPQNQIPNPADVQMMMAALPGRAPATPKQPRKVLVLGRAAGFVHSSIPLAARTVEEMGRKTRAWSTTITYDAADINEQNLKQYDAIFLASTTGAFLDDLNDEAATAARRKALLEFVRGGKGLAGIHAASDSYHRSTTASPGRSAAPAPAGGGRGDAPPRPAPPLGPTGFPIQPPATQLGPDTQIGTWPEFNKLIGGFFKFHWNDGQIITVKIDEPNHPLNAAFKGQSFQVIDETYTFGRQTYSRENLRVLTSIDYAKMSAEDKAKEQYPRGDGDYALSWIRREGKGRVFYEAHGHNEKVYAMTPILEHVLAGIQYVLGDLAADDRPIVRSTSR